MPTWGITLGSKDNAGGVDKGPATRDGKFLFVHLNSMWFTHWYTGLPYTAESMSVGLDVSKRVYIDQQQIMFLQLGTNSGRWKVNLNDVSYFKMSGAGKMDLPDGSPPPLADNAVGNRQRQVIQQRGVLNAVRGQNNPYQSKSWLVLSEFKVIESRLLRSC